LRGLTILSDGSLAVVGEGSACVLGPDAKALSCYKFLGLLPREGLAALFGASDGALILHEGSLVTRFRLQGAEAVRQGSMLLKKEVSQAVPLGASIVAFLDGRSVNTVSSSGAHSEWTPPGTASVLHLVPVQDGVWVSLTDQRVVLLNGDKVVRSLPTERRVISLSADEENVAVLTSDDGQHRLHVSLYEPTGKNLWSAELPWPTPPLIDKDPYVSLSPFAPVVVVGSAATLQVWERASGKPLGQAG
jgi:hypothetical protein